VRLARDAGILPPRTAPEGIVSAYLNNETAGLPTVAAQSTYESTGYKPKLSLDFLGQPMVGVGVDSFGSYVGGGISAAFSDILGNHTVGTMLQVNGGLRDFGGIIGYENRKHRWAWGAGLEQIPYVTGTFSTGTGRIGNEPVIIEETELFRQTNRSASSYIAYPFSRAQRLELSGAVRNIGFSSERVTQVFSAVTGEMLADVRQYFMPVRPFTLAFRGLHYGRYGGGSEDRRISRLFIGYPNLVRGYDVGSFDARECGVGDPNSSCPVFDQLLGSKILVGNAELSFPPFGEISRNRHNLYGPLPLELLIFGDTGVAWTEADKPTFLDGSRKLVSSIGTGARVNVFGYAIVEVDYVKPLDRDRGWRWVFNLAPGF
jgi:hypothetical protein